MGLPESLRRPQPDGKVPPVRVEKLEAESSQRWHGLIPKPPLLFLLFLLSTAAWNYPEWSQDRLQHISALFFFHFQSSHDMSITSQPPLTGNLSRMSFSRCSLGARADSTR